MGLPWFAAAKLVPWQEILVHGPRILDTARKIYERIADKKISPVVQSLDPNSAADLETLRLSVNRIAENQKEQVKLLRDAAIQIEALTKAVEALRIRVVVAAGVALIALLAAIASLALVLWR
jgi:benzoyl-CoA reductase/2-hydroxyglutaryl-CoA dehydratase subunit BcrC/BadD/HgdB